jgi:uncharacterized membrane protein
MHERQARLEADVIGSSDNTAGLMARGLALVVAALSVIKPCAAQIPCYQVSATIQGPSCGILGDSITVGTAINSHGHVTGYWNCPGGGAYRPFIWKPETGLVTLPLPPWLLEAIPSDINDNGWICGTGAGPVTGQVGWVRTDTGEWIELQSLNPPSGWTGANAINNNNVVCGYRSSGNGPTPRQAFTWNPTTGYTNLGVMIGPNSEAMDISDKGAVVGWTGGAILAPGSRGFISHESRLTILDAIPGGLSSAALAINEHLHVLVWGDFLPSGGPNSMYLWIDGNMADIGVLPGFQRTVARSINTASVVVGNCSTRSGSNGASFLWRTGTMRALDDLIHNTMGLTRIRGTRVNDADQITGQAEISHHIVGIVLNPLDIVLGDTNCDNIVNVDDLLQVINSWGPCIGCSTDFNDDGTVDVQDVLIVLRSWSE